jgi:hypothetical protein
MNGYAGRPPRLLTIHNTVLYVDPASRKLSHGPRDCSPRNVRLAMKGFHGELMYEEDGVLRPIVYRGGDFTASGNADEEPPRTTFEVVSLDDGRVALRSDGYFLTAVMNSKNLTLCAKICSSWEHFALWDPPPPRRATGVGRFAQRMPSLSITCVAAYKDERHVSPAVRAVESTLQCIRAECLYWFSNAPYPNCLPELDVIDIAIPAIRDFNDDISMVHLQLLPRVMTTDFTLVVQPDGFAVNPMAWDDNFWKYDYVGAVWPWMWGPGPYRGGPIVGNGGFSLRSRKLCNALLDIRPKWRVEDWVNDERLNFTPAHFYGYRQGQKVIHEDYLICIWYRKVLETSYDISFCPPELANRFSVESTDPFTKYWVGHSFGFHGPGMAPYYGVKL